MDFLPLMIYIDPKEDTKMQKDLRVVVLQRGWVLVGDYLIDPETQICSLKNSYTIRTWGTSNGLGELVKNGPLKSTVLDENYGDVEFHKLTEIMNIRCESVVWAAALKLSNY